MDERMNPEELRSLLGVFALGALDADEREAVEQFVLDDRDARAELHQLEHAVAWLGHASPRPSALAWDLVRAEMDQDLAGHDQTTSDQTTSDPLTAGATVTSIANAPSRRVGGWRKLTAIAAAVTMVVGISAAVIQVIQTDSTSTPIATPLARITLRTPDQAVAVRMNLARNGTGTIDAASLPTAPIGHEYQLWTQATADGPMHSAGVLGRKPHAGRSVRLPRHAALMAISVEPEGGSLEPTTSPVAVSRPQPF